MPLTAAMCMSTGSPLFTWLLWIPDMFRQNKTHTAPAHSKVAAGRNLHLDDPPFAPDPNAGQAASLSLFEN
jgi:hypothetical protein